MKNQPPPPKTGSENLLELITPSIDEIELDQIAELAMVITSLIQGVSPKVDPTVCFSITYDILLAGATAEEALEKGKFIAAKDIGIVQ